MNIHVIGCWQFCSSFDTVVTVRSEEKGKRIIEAHPDVSNEKLSYVIVKDVAQDGAFDEVSRTSFPQWIHN